MRLRSGASAGKTAPHERIQHCLPQGGYGIKRAPRRQTTTEVISHTRLITAGGVPRQRGRSQKRVEDQPQKEHSMADVTMRRMLEAGVHFGHQTRFWNPKMAEFIFGERNKIHIINLDKTVPSYKAASEFVRRLVADGGTLLFVGSKRAAREAMAAEAVRCGMPYVTQRWLGGMLTNFKTIRQSIKRLKSLEEITEPGAAVEFTKKELLKFG